MEPLVIRIKKAEEALFSVVNAAIKEQDLPCYILEPLIAKVHSEVSAAALREYEIAKKQTEKTKEAGGEDNGP